MSYERITERVGEGGGESVRYKYGADKTLGQCLVNILGRLAELEDKIVNKKLVFIPELSEKYAIIKYTFWKKQPFDIAMYYPYGVKMNGDIDYRFSGLKSGNITVIEDGFTTKEDAEVKLKELKGD